MRKSLGRHWLIPPLAKGAKDGAPGVLLHVQPKAKLEKSFPLSVEPRSLLGQGLD
jgi:hypothetical protein